MHYYKRNLGDYAKKAGRLSMLQHGAYTLLIDACYDREQFPTLEEAIDWAWASSAAEIEAVEFVLRKFFVLEDGRYVQKRIQEEIDAYHAVAETNARIARERETKRAEKSTKRARSVHEAPRKEHEAPPNQEPLTINQVKQKQQHVQPSAARFDEFWSEYPVKKGKAAAEKSWRRLGCDRIADEIIAHVRRMRDVDDDWARGFAPHGATYVNGKRWHDEPKPMPRAGPAAIPSKHLTGMAGFLGVDPHELARSNANPRLVHGADSARANDPVRALPARLSGV